MLLLNKFRAELSDRKALRAEQSALSCCQRSGPRLGRRWLAMTAGAAAAAMESARIVSESARREREAEKEKQAAADAALAELTAGKKDFGAMMKALAAQRKAGLLEEEGPPGLEALLKPRDDGDYAGEVVGRVRARAPRAARGRRRAIEL